MRLNKFIAQASGLSRRAADAAIAAGEVRINGEPAQLGQAVAESDQVTLRGRLLTTPVSSQTIMLNKPAGYVCSRDGQGRQTIYDLLSEEYHHLKPVGRLDKDSSGLLLMTDDGQLAYELTHPKFQKEKVYQVSLGRDLTEDARQKIVKGVMLDDGLSKLQLTGQGRDWTVKMSEGRNRQIRRTFAAIGYTVSKLHRTRFGNYRLNQLQPGEINILPSVSKTRSKLI